MNRWFACLSVALITLLTGCGKKSEADALRATYESEGWAFVENVGTPIEDARFLGGGASATGRTITAFSSDGHTQTKREYEQVSHLYRTATFQSPSSGATYTMVFQKKKEAIQSPETTRGK